MRFLERQGAGLLASPPPADEQGASAGAAPPPPLRFALAPPSVVRFGGPAAPFASVSSGGGAGAPAPGRLLLKVRRGAV